jgi:hypothetical protein
MFMIYYKFNILIINSIVLIIMIWLDTLCTQLELKYW